MPQEEGRPGIGEKIAGQPGVGGDHDGGDDDAAGTCGSGRTHTRWRQRSGRPFVDRRYRRLFSNPQARKRHGPRLVPRIDRELWHLTAAELSLDLALGRALRRLKEGSRYRRLGFTLWRDYVRERVGIEARWSQYLVQLDRGCERVPELRAALERGELSSWKALTLLRVLGPETPLEERRRWITRAAGLSVRQLEREIRREKERAVDGERGTGGESGNGGETGNEGRRGTEDERAGDGADDRFVHPSESPPGRWLEFRVPARTAVLWSIGVEAVRRLTSSDLPPHRCLEYMIAERFSGAGWPDDLAELVRSEVEEERRRRAAERARRREKGQDDTDPDENEETTSALERLEAACAAAARGWRFLCWQRQALALDPELDPMAVGDPWELDRIVGSLEALRKEIRQLAGELLEAMVALAGWRLLGFASMAHYGRERLGFHPKQIQRLIRFGQAVRQHRPLEQAYLAGELNYLQTLLLLRVVHPRTVEEWVAWARKSTCRATEQMVEQAQFLSFPGATPEMLASYARILSGTISFAGAGSPSAGGRATSSAPGDTHQAGSGDNPDPNSDPNLGADPLPLGIALPPTTFLGLPRIIGLDPHAARAGLERLGGFQRLDARIRIYCPNELLPFIRAGLRSCTDDNGAPIPHWRALELLVLGVMELLDDPDIKRVIEAFPVLERDGWRCQVPTCSQRAGLNPHHLKRRGQGGSDELWNQIALCVSCHLGQVHGGHRSVTVSGRAPDQLIWEIGRRGGGKPPLLRFHGEEKVDPIGPRRRSRPPRKCQPAKEHAKAPPARAERPPPPTQKPGTAAASAG